MTARTARRPAGERRLRQQVVTFLSDDPWRKLLALVLATGLWLYLDAQLSRDVQLRLDLRSAPRSAATAALSAEHLTIGIDLQRYSVLGFVDPRDDAPLRGVLLDLHGPGNLIDALTASAGLLVVPDVGNDGAQPSVEFGAGDLRYPEPRLRNLAVRMTPERVRVLLAENSEKRVLLTPERIRFVPPAREPDLAGRLLWDRARFEPRNEITLRGPANRIDALLETGRTLLAFEPPAPRADQTELRGVLTPDLGDPTVRCSELPSLTVPLRSADREYTLPGVPVLLHEPPGLRGRFRPLREREDVHIAASGLLAGRLAALDDRQLRAWVDANCLIVATVPPDAGGADVAPRPRVIIGSDFREGKDYKLTLPLTIQYEPRK